MLFPWWPIVAATASGPGAAEVRFFTITGLAVIGITAYLVWKIGSGVRAQLVQTIREEFKADPFRDAVRNSAGDWVRDITRAETSEALMRHDQNKAAHRAALESYPERRELQGALDRMELLMDSKTELICQKLDALAQRFEDHDKA